MSSERDLYTKQVVSDEIRALQEHCVEAIHMIENLPLNNGTSSENVTEKALNYIEGLRTEIQNSNTPIITDENLLTALFLNELKERTIQVKEMTAFLRGSISDVDSEIDRLKNQIKIVEEAKSFAYPQHTQVQPTHLQSARAKFQILKTELHGLIASLFPDKMEDVKDILAELMTAKIQEDSLGYIPITSENFAVMQLLKEKNVVVTNPYNNAEVKLAL